VCRDSTAESPNFARNPACVGRRARIDPGDVNGEDMADIALSLRGICWKPFLTIGTSRNFW